MVAIRLKPDIKKIVEDEFKKSNEKNMSDFIKRVFFERNVDKIEILKLRTRLRDKNEK
jgi:hypothetical protein